MTNLQTIERPAHFYKYRAINSYTQNGIINNEIFFAKPSMLNDPFDCKAHYVVEFTVDQIETKIADIVSKYLPYADNTAETEAFNKGVTYMLESPKEQVAKMYAHLMEQALDIFAGVFSMSAKNDDILMWAHYSDSHKGICLEFDSSEGMFETQSEKIIYTEQLPCKNYMTINSQDSDILLTKAKNWEYEEEWRILRQTGVKQYSPKCLTGVILGMAISEFDEEQVRRWIKESKSKPILYKAKRKKSEYGLDIVPD